jgi:hypothetical protein
MTYGLSRFVYYVQLNNAELYDASGYAYSSLEYEICQTCFLEFYISVALHSLDILDFKQISIADIIHRQC